MKYPVITLWQPWAQWVALGWKTIETRTHNKLKSLVGRKILIHAGQEWDKNAIQAASPYLAPSRIAQTVNGTGMFETMRKAPGHIIASAWVEDHRVLTFSTDSKQALIECETPRFGLLLHDIRYFPSIHFIPAQGKQGIWYHEVKA